MQLKNIRNNLIFGFLSQIITIVLGIFIPRLFIISYGSGMNGLISSIGQIFVYFGLFEAGVGTATLVALYGPVARDDKQAISAILSATNIYYRRTGVIYFISVFSLAIIYPVAIPTGIDNVTARLVILLTGLVGVVNYFFQGKFCLLLQAEGKNYIITNLRTIVAILTNTAKIILLMNRYNVIAVESTYLLFNLVQMLYINNYIKKKYTWLDLSVKPNYEAIARKNAVLVHQISTLVFSNTDIIILTVFTNLKVVSVYTLYTLLFGAISMITSTITNSFTFILGQTYNEDMKKYLKLHDAYELYYLALVFALYSIAYVFILPFLKLYTAGITDITYIDKYLPVLFVSVFLLSNARATSSQAVSYAGYFKETKWRSVLESVINISFSLVFVKLLGIYGVLIGTIAALLYRTNDLIIYANRHVLKRSPWITYRRVLRNLFLFLLVAFASSLISIDLHTYIVISMWAAIYCIIIIPLAVLVNLLCERDIFKSSVVFIKPYIHKVWKLSKSSNICL